MEDIERQLACAIMRKIERIHFWRTVLRPFVLECAFLAALLGSSAFFVSLNNIFRNAYSHHSFVDFYLFTLAAFVETELHVKTLAIAACIVVVLILRDISFGAVSGISRAVRRVRAAF